MSAFATKSIIPWCQSILTCAVILATWEVLHLAAESDWLGSATSGGRAFLQTLVVYAGLLAVLSIPIAIPLSKIQDRVDVAAFPAATYLAAVALMSVVALENQSQLSSTTTVLLALIVGCLVALRQNRFSPQWRRSLEVILVTAFLAAAIAAHEIRYAWIQTDYGHQIAPAFAVLIAIAVFLYAAYAWARATDRGWRWTAVARIAIAALAVPLGLRAYADYSGFLTRKPGPQILLISADTLRADYCSLYGGPVPTPNLDRLAQQGATFDRAYALSSWTVPSLCGLMSSRFPPSTSADATDDEWKVDITTGYPKIADYWTSDEGRTLIGDLQRIGVPTAMFMANLAMMSHSWLQDDFGLARGTFNNGDQRVGMLTYAPLLHATVRGNTPRLAPMAPYDTSAITRDYTRAYLRQRRFGPFFVWAHFFDPHSPYAPRGKYKPDGVIMDVFPPTGTTKLGGAGESDAERDTARKLYEGEIRYVDDCIGDVLRHVDRLGLDDSTLVVFTSDHGEEFWDHGEYGHGHALHEELIRSPLIFRGPDIKARRIQTPVSAIDVLPTLSGWIGAGGRPKWRGTDLMPYLKTGADLPAEPVYVGATYRFGVDTEPFEGVVWKRFKLVRGIRSGQVRLYDLESDPGERNDLAAENPDALKEYTALLDAWNESFPSRIDQLWNRPEQLDMNHEAVQALDALGYI